MDFDELKKLVRLVEKSNINELQVVEDGKKIKITKSPEGVAYHPHPAAYAPVHAPQPHAAAETSKGGAKGAEAVDEDEGNYHLIKSPMVGTFYRAPAEDAEPYVKEGDFVNKGQVVCIIEAMKLMNEIDSDVKGKIVSILVENGSPVEYGQAIFKIEPV
ncbi:MAG: acetyl-CoA carboxylase biotin carboxyl carrier protein [Nitrospinota bacterium]|nr:acetyl-CoA carboxylase biotin carboxyl carrier protein [Nitrospinota bacterium]